MSILIPHTHTHTLGECQLTAHFSHSLSNKPEVTRKHSRIDGAGVKRWEPCKKTGSDHQTKSLQWVTLLFGWDRGWAFWLSPKFGLSRGRDQTWSELTGLVLVPRLRTKFGERAFSFSGPSAWNALPADIRDEICTATFKKKLKTLFLPGVWLHMTSFLCDNCNAPAFL